MSNVVNLRTHKRNKELSADSDEIKHQKGRINGNKNWIVEGIAFCVVFIGLRTGYMEYSIKNRGLLRI
jgi:hypothetical protein